MDVLNLIIVLALSAASAWYIAASLRPEERRSLLPKDSYEPQANLPSFPEPPWNVGTVYATILIIVFVSLGVVASFAILREVISLTSAIIIGIVLSATTYFSRSKKNEIDPGDFFTCFSQGFTWPAVLPALSGKIGPSVISTIITPTPTPTLTPIPTPTVGELLHHIVVVASIIQNWF